MKATLLERATRFLKTGLDATASKSVVIRDGADAIDNIKAVPGSNDFLQYTQDAYTGTAKTFDWVVSAADLVFPEGKREPKTGWEIWFQLEDGRTAVYTVRPDDGTREFDVVDHLGILLRIHTKLDRIEQP